MKIPKRLPKLLQELVEMEHVFRCKLTLIAAEMKRRKGSVYIELTYVENTYVLGDRFVTLDSDLHYDKDKKEIREYVSSQERRADIYRKVVMAS